MGETITLKSAYDGFELSAYHARPTDARRGGLLLIQEIFGVTDHIRELADAFAADGYETIAPAFYDRLEKGFEADYGQEAVAKGVRYSQETPWDQVAGDAQAAIDALKAPVFVTGFCWGGAATWLVASRCTGVSAASAFYGRRITELKDETPKVPIILHFGKTDASIPPERVEEIREAYPDLPTYLYDAGHGFFSDRRADYHPDSARLARLRTLALFSNNGGWAELGVILQTPRLRLRPLEDADLDALCAITADPQVMAFVGDGLVLGRAATAQWITNAGASVRLGGIGSRAITLREDGLLIGWAGLIPTSEEHRLELIYGLARAYWGQGYAAEAAQAILTTTQESVDATIDPENGASRHILTGLGFTVVGMETDENGLETLRLRRS